VLFIIKSHSICISDESVAHENKNMIDYLQFYVPLKNFSLIWRCHYYRWRAAKFRPMLGAQGLSAGRDLYCATPAVTRDLGFIRGTAPIGRLLRHIMGCGGSILTQINKNISVIQLTCLYCNHCCNLMNSELNKAELWSFFAETWCNEFKRSYFNQSGLFILRQIVLQISLAYRLAGTHFAY
jgi:hypothetical protein